MRGGVLYIDGASRGNPGPAGVGVKIVGEEDGRVLSTISKYIGLATNNVAEYMALIFGLQEALRLELKKVEVLTDSELLSRQLNHEYKVREPRLRLLYEQALHLTGMFDKFEIRHCERTRNREADRLANKAISNEATTYGVRRTT